MIVRRVATAAAIAVFGVTMIVVTGAEAQALGCGDLVLQDTVLANDVGPCPGTGLRVGDGVTLDLGRHTVSGSGSGAGIEIVPGFSQEVRNGAVTGFGTGVTVAGTSATVERLSIQDNGAGMGIGGRGSTIVRETVVSHNIGDGVLIGSGNNTVERSVIADNGGNGVSIVNAATIFENRAARNRILGNSISGNLGNGVDVSVGSLFTAVGVNVISGNGGNGIHIRAAALPASASGNIIVGNSLNGILVENRPNDTGFIANNSVTSNRAEQNGVGSGGFDLADRNPNCAGTVWSGNTFLTRNQPCIS